MQVSLAVPRTKRSRNGEKMIPISVCMIAKNEEKYIGECLRRLKAYGFELVVVDTGSEDRTKEIAMQYTDKVYDFAWCDDFSKAKNFAVSKASNDWILNVDCDEHLSNEINLEELESLMKENPKACGNVEIVSPTSQSKDASMLNARIARLFDRRYFHYESPIHEQLVDENGIGAPEFKAPISFLHYGYALEGEKRKNKNLRNIRLLEKQLKHDKKNPYIYFQLGRSYRMEKDWKSALECYEKAISLDFNPNATYGKMLIVDYAQTLIDLGDYEKALRIEMVKDLFSDFTDYVFMLGRVYYLNKQYVKALQQFIKVMNMEEGMLAGNNTYLAYYMLAQIYHDIEQPEMEAVFREKYNESVPKVTS